MELVYEDDVHRIGQKVEELRLGPVEGDEVVGNLEIEGFRPQSFRSGRRLEGSQKTRLAHLARPQQYGHLPAAHFGQQPRVSRPSQKSHNTSLYR
ncbi:MAG: hypothetical protein FD126_1230 [Elusimicrobia bacterium]|nr:MAG: hypothetical protein FD126_1230 [Elusimicrobiota bacterium]